MICGARESTHLLATRLIAAAGTTTSALAASSGGWAALLGTAPTSRRGQSSVLGATGRRDRLGPCIASLNLVEQRELLVVLNAHLLCELRYDALALGVRAHFCIVCGRVPTENLFERAQSQVVYAPRSACARAPAAMAEAQRLIFARTNRCPTSLWPLTATGSHIRRPLVVLTDSACIQHHRSQRRFCRSETVCSTVCVPWLQGSGGCELDKNESSRSTLTELMSSLMLSAVARQLSALD